ncbi:MAG TPA: hypothetical protein VIJ59_01075 [Caulobacteraceae bacterium]
MSPKPSSFFVRHVGAARVARLAPFFALGPISGPLTAGIVLNFRRGNPVLATLYCVALTLWLVLAPVEAAHMLPATLAKFV